MVYDQYLGGTCRSKVTVKLQKQFTTPKDAAKLFNHLENVQPLAERHPRPLLSQPTTELSEDQSILQIQTPSHPSATQPPTHPLVSQQEFSQLESSPHTPTPSHPSSHTPTPSPPSESSPHTPTPSHPSESSSHTPTPSPPSESSPHTPTPSHSLVLQHTLL